jgi:SAM-dependent methyltransferase
MVDFRSLYDGREEYVLRRLEGSYNARRLELEVRHFKIPNLLKVLPKEFSYTSIAEIGCGTGEIIGAFPGENVNRRVGFDISPLNISCARQRFRNVEFHDLDFRSWNEKFDLLILSDILEHVPDGVHFLMDASKMAKLLLVNLPLEKCLLYSFRKYGPKDPSGHLAKFSMNDALKMFHAADLRIIEWYRGWTMESRYETRRQELNEEMTGKKFSGGDYVQTVKGILFIVSNKITTVGRLVFPSNLFVSAIKNDFSR